MGRTREHCAASRTHPLREIPPDRLHKCQRNAPCRAEAASFYPNDPADAARPWPEGHVGPNSIAGLHLVDRLGDVLFFRCDRSTCKLPHADKAIDNGKFLALRTEEIASIAEGSDGNAHVTLRGPDPGGRRDDGRAVTAPVDQPQPVNLSLNIEPTTLGELSTAATRLALALETHAAATAAVPKPVVLTLSDDAKRSLDAAAHASAADAAGLAALDARAQQLKPGLERFALSIENLANTDRTERELRYDCEQAKAAQMLPVRMWRYVAGKRTCSGDLKVAGRQSTPPPPAERVAAEQGSGTQ